MTDRTLSSIALLSLAAALASTLVVALDIAAGRRQTMRIMNVVWPLTTLYSGPLGLTAYFWFGRARQRDGATGHGHSASQRPFWQSVALATTHCGSGCTLGDLVSENLVIAVPLALFGHAIFGTWLLDYAFAFLFGIAFQYFTIKPMRGLSPVDGLKAALKADAASLTAWQIGMYGWMAIVVFVVFDREIPKTDPVFWFMMQIAMLAGFATSYPVNAWLVTKGWKERM